MTRNPRGPAIPFELVVREHGATVRRVCRALLPPADADDAWSETFLAALRAYPDLRPDSNVVGWLVTIAHNKSIDHHRHRARAPKPMAESVDRPVAPEVGEAESDTALRAALESLPPKQRGAVVARYLADLAYADVAVLLGCNEAAARRNAADGIAALRRTYGSGKDAQ